MKNINERFKELRKTLTISQKEFSKRVLVSPSYISKIESGKEEPSEMFVKLTSLEFNISWEWLAKGNGSMYIKKDEHDFFERNNDEYFKNEIDKVLLPELTQTIRNMDCNLIGLACIIDLLNNMLSVSNISDGQKHLLINVISGTIIDLENAVNTAVNVDKSNSAKIYSANSRLNMLNSQSHINDLKMIFLTNDNV